MRYGTRTHCKRRWTRSARRPVCCLKLGYEWAYLYVALCPFTGDTFALFLSHLDKICFSFFLEQLQDHLRKKGSGQILLIGDGATAHTAQHWPDYPLDWQQLPAACPELNPVERFFKELRQQTANRVFDNKQQVENLLSQLVQQYQQQPAKIKQLTCFPYMKISA